MTQVKIQTLRLLSGDETCVEVFFLVHRRNYTELEGKYSTLPKDCFLYYWETQIISQNNLVDDFSPLQIKEGKPGTIGSFLSYCNTPPKSEEMATTILKKMMLCSYLAMISGIEEVRENLKQKNTDCVCKEIEKKFCLKFSLKSSILSQKEMVGELQKS